MDVSAIVACVIGAGFGVAWMVREFRNTQV